MRFVDGESPVLLIAPLGGRRPADAPIKDSLKVNDLYTAELTEEIAARTRGYALINQTFDRNLLDLNRISRAYSCAVVS
jgi:N-formylglutamate amidohydrolase